MILLSTIGEEDGNGIVGWLGLGFIKWNEQTDKYDNKVSLIQLPDGTGYRMVHHKSTGYYEYATIYAGHNKFMRFKYRETQLDSQANTISLGGYSMSWGDGDPMHAENHPDGPDLRPILSQITESDYCKTQFILNVLFHAGNVDACWDSKPTE